MPVRAVSGRRPAIARVCGAAPVGGRCAASDAAITPPPRQTSPSYSTADWPGVTAHCGCVEGELESCAVRVGPSAQRAGRVGLPVARLGRIARRAPARAPATQLASSAIERRDSSHGWSWPCTTRSVLRARSLRATNQGACSPPPRCRARVLDAADADALALAQRVEATGRRARRSCGRARPRSAPARCAR